MLVYRRLMGDSMVVPCTTAYSTAVLNDNPVHYYRFEESSGNVIDYGSRGVNGSVAGTPSRQEANPLGNLCDAYLFNMPWSHDPNASREYIDSGGIFSEPELFNSDFSIELWIRVDADTTAEDFTTIIGKHDATDATRQSWVIRHRTSGAVEWWFRYGTSGGQATTGASMGSLGVGSTPQHIVLVGEVDGGGPGLFKLSGYLNGSFIDGSTHDVSAGRKPLSVATPLTIGATGPNNGSNDPRFPGLIDEVALYDYKLTGTQISNHYNVRT